MDERDAVAALVEDYMSRNPNHDVVDFTTNQLKSLSTLVSEQIKLEKLLQRLKEATADANKELKTVQGKLVDVMTECQVPTFSFLDGNEERMVHIKTAVSAKIAVGKEAEAINWFVEHGFEGLLSLGVSVKMRKGMPGVLEAARKLKHDLSAQGLTAETSAVMHHATLAAFMRKQLESDEPVVPPMDVVPYTTYRYTEVK